MYKWIEPFSTVLSVVQFCLSVFIWQTFALNIYIKKVKCTLVQALRLYTGLTAHRESRGIALLFHDHGTRRGWGVSVTPRPLFTPGKTRYPLYRRLGGPQGRTGQVRKISPPSGFDPRTVQPVASRYTDYATRSTYMYKTEAKGMLECNSVQTWHKKVQFVPSDAMDREVSEVRSWQSTAALLKPINPLNAELNLICHLLALLEAHHILHVSRIRVNNRSSYCWLKSDKPILRLNNSQWTQQLTKHTNNQTHN